MDEKCPGTDTRFLRVYICKCPKCGYEVEIFSDELKVKCPKCKTDVYKEDIPSCINYCQYAYKCISEEKWQQIKNHINKPQRNNVEKKR